jgi:hypothetical protein
MRTHGHRKDKSVTTRAIRSLPRWTHGSDRPAIPTELELFGGEPGSSKGSNPDQMREFLHSLLAEARSAKIMPWPPLTAQLYRGLFPQLSFWLPEDEGEQLRLAFETELARLEAA